MKLYENGAYRLNGKEVIIDGPEAQAAVKSKTGMDIDKQTAKQEMCIRDRIRCWRKIDVKKYSIY